MLPELNENGDLPPGVHAAGWIELERRFGTQTPARVRGMATLRLLYRLARQTGCLRNFYVYGSFISARAEPRDVDVLLIMGRDFNTGDCPFESKPVFAHLEAQACYGASVFWFWEGARSPAFLRAWQLTRDGTVRGIVEIA